VRCVTAAYRLLLIERASELGNDSVIEFPSESILIAKELPGTAYTARNQGGLHPDFTVSSANEKARRFPVRLKTSLLVKEIDGSIVWGWHCMIVG
jgi:hypothetical protein